MGDDVLVALARLGGGALHGESVRLQGSLERAGMVVGMEAPSNELGDAPQAPALVWKTCRHGAALDQSLEPTPLLRLQPRRTTGARPGLKPCLPGPPELLVPGAHRRAAHPKRSGDLRIAEPSLPKQRRRRSSALLELPHRPLPWSPRVHRASLGRPVRVAKQESDSSAFTNFVEGH